MPLEDLVLLGRGQPPVQRDDLGVPEVFAVERVGGVADLPLAAEEHQDVAVALGAELVDRGGDAVDLVDRLVVLLLVLDGLHHQRPVTHLDRIGPPGDLDDRSRPLRTAEVLGEALGLDRGRRDDQLEVGAAWQQVPQVAEDEVDVEAALVRLVDDQRVVAPQHPIVLQLGEQDAVGHHLDHRVVGDLIGEADLVAHCGPERPVELLGDAFGDGPGGDPARLRVPDLAADPPAQLEADLGQLGGLAGAGLAGDDHDLVVADGSGDVVPALAHRQVVGIGDRGYGRQARVEPQLRGLDAGLDLGQCRGPCGVVLDPAHAVQPALQAALVAR